MQADIFKDRLTLFCQKHIASNGSVEHCSRLSGGASMESWLVKFSDREYVLRRLPSGLDGALSDDIVALGLELPLLTQGALIELARKSGVTAPEVVACLSEDDGMGQGFLMTKANGEALPHRIFKTQSFDDQKGEIARQCAQELAKIHAISASSLPEQLPETSPLELVNRQLELYHDLGSQIPMFDFTLGWLKRNVPEHCSKALVHGDFRMGNILISGHGLEAVLDWELSVIGDPIQDLAYFCAPSWRFGRYESEAGGLVSIDQWIIEYERARNVSVDRQSFNWYLIYSTLWWGIACLRMGQSYRDGSVPTMERTIIGRRVSEVEIDLLLLFEPYQQAGPLVLDWQDPPEPDVRGEIRPSEIIDALGRWNTNNISKTPKGHELFEQRVAGNALGILSRAMELNPVFERRAQDRLQRLSLNHHHLCSQLSKNDSLFDSPQLWDHLRLSVIERLTIDQPKYAGLHLAKRRWEGK